MDRWDLAKLGDWRAELQAFRRQRWLEREPVRCLWLAAAYALLVILLSTSIGHCPVR